MLLALLLGGGSGRHGGVGSVKPGGHLAVDRGDLAGAHHVLAGLVLTLRTRVGERGAGCARDRAS